MRGGGGAKSLDAIKKLDVASHLYGDLGHIRKAVRCCRNGLFRLWIRDFFKNHTAADNERLPLIKHLGLLKRHNRHFIRSNRCFFKAIEICNRLGREEELPLLFNELGRNYEHQNNFSEALKYYEMGLEICERVNDIKNRLSLMSNIANIQAYAYRKFDYAISVYKDVLEVANETNNLPGRAFAKHNIATTLFMKGERENAVELSKDAVKEAKSIGDFYLITLFMTRLGELYIHMKDFNQAIEVLTQVRTIYSELCSDLGEAETCEHLAAIQLTLGNRNKGLSLLREALELYTQCGNARRANGIRGRIADIELM